MANGACYSASSPLSSGRPNSAGLLADDCTLETLSSQGLRAVKGSPRASLSLTRQARRKDSFRTLKARQRRSAVVSHQLSTSYDPQDVNDWSLPKLATSVIPGQAAAAEDLANDGVPSRPEPRRFHSSPVALPNQSAPNAKDYDGGAKTQDEHARLQNLDQPGDMMDVEPKPPNDPPLSAIDSSKPDEVFRQPETNPITEEQLIHEVRAIYAGLVIVEKKCIEIDKQQSESISKSELSSSQWQTMIALHRTLLHEHHDFFLASQHPSASPVLKRLAGKYAMPARLWRYGIHSFLELLRQKLPASLEYMLSFIYLAYSMMTLLLESVPAFEETWIECLGDLARYRMAVEEVDMRDRETWAGVARYWYNKDAEGNPDVGRIQHHLAILARPDLLQQLFYYTKALVSVHPFPKARESIMLLFNPLLNGQTSHQPPAVSTFVAAHGALFTRCPAELFVALANEFLSLLHEDIGRLGRHGHQGVLITSCNLAAVCEYGESGAFIASAFVQKQHSNVMETYTSAMDEWTTDQLSMDNFGADAADSAHQACRISSQLAFLGTSLASHTISVMLDQIGDLNMYASVHTFLAFVWSLSLHPPAMRHIEMLIPWTKLAIFLNTLLRPDTNFSKIESEIFPLLDDGASRQLPEDSLIRGQAWSQLYYPEKFFEAASIEDRRPPIEEPSSVIPRRHRCLWLGVRIARFGRWLTYSHNPRRFAATQLAHVFAPIAETCGQLNHKAPSA